jgi:hypothetical protein
MQNAFCASFPMSFHTARARHLRPKRGGGDRSKKETVAKQLYQK